MKRLPVVLFFLLLVSCNGFQSLNRDYFNALVLKAENERDKDLLREALNIAGNNEAFLKRIAIASGRIPDFQVFRKVAGKSRGDKEIADLLAITSMFNGANFNKRNLVKILSSLPFTEKVAVALLNTKDKMAFNIVLNRNKLMKYKLSPAIAFNLWRAKPFVNEKILKEYYEKSPFETVYSLYRLKVKGIAKAKDLKDADLNTKFYAMWIVDNPEKLLDENIWQLKVAYLKATEDKNQAKELLNDKNPLVKETAISVFLKKGGNWKVLDLNSFTPSQIEIALPYIKDAKVVRKIFEKGGFYAYVSAPYLSKQDTPLVESSNIGWYKKLKFFENIEGKSFAIEKAISIFEKSGDKKALCYLIEKVEEGVLKKSKVITLVGDKQGKYLSILSDAGIVKGKSKKLPLSYYLGAIKKAEKLKTFTIETDRGKVKCKFFSKDAPLTCLNFFKLADRGFFDGIFFHRVIPGFVAQAGDPTGTGYGGPNYSIRCEYNAFSYNSAGIIGMALAGKDTGGSQFFITHIATPHLNYNYTVFAKVIDNFETLSRITRYTEIKKINKE